MSTLEKFLTAIVGIALVTTLVLPNRSTGTVFTTGGQAISGLLSTAMGTASVPATAKTK
jgi:hypothetical protein